MITNEDQASIRSAPEKLIGVGVRFERIRRITGYLVGTVDRFKTSNAPKSATAWRI